MKNYSRRERVADALDHIEPDRVPADITLSPGAYAILCDHLGEKFEPYKWDDWNHATPSAEVLEKLGVDVYHVDIGAEPEGFTIDKTEFKDAWGINKRKIINDDGSFMYCFTDTPLKDAKTIDEINSYKWPLPEQLVSLTDERVSEIKNLFNNTDFALTATFGGNIQERPHFLIGMEQWFMNFYDNPELNCALMDKIMEIQMGVDRIVIDKIGKYLTYFRFNGEDVGTQKGPLYSPDIFKEYAMPRLMNEWKTAKQLFLKQNPRGKVAIHSCGSIYHFIPLFIEMGADIINPVQVNADNMDTGIIGREFGDKVSFHGAVDSQDVLEHGTPEDVRKEVRKRMADLGAGGGYIVAPSHNIQESVPVKNTIALYEAVQEYGKYPLI